MGWVISDSLPYQSNTHDLVDVLIQPYPEGFFASDRDSLPTMDHVASTLDVLVEPYPVGVFTSDGNTLPTMDHITSVVDVLVEPYPEGVFIAKSGELPTITSVSEVIPVFTQPYPEGLCQHFPGKLPKYKHLERVKMGAFLNSTKLANVNIPSSVTSIGEYTFAGTAMSAVTIPSGCSYYTTSFPNMCDIEIMDGDNV